MKFLQFSLFFTLFCSSLFAQEIDSEIPKSELKTYNALAKFLAKDETSDKSKVNAIYKWVTENIEYDYAALDASTYSDGADPKDVFKKKKAICGGYVALMSAMLEEVGIESEPVVGYIRSAEWQPGQLVISETHAWIAIKFGYKWYLADLTWDAGYIGRIPNEIKPFKSKKYLKNSWKKERKERNILAKRSKKDSLRKVKYDEKPKFSDKIGFVRNPSQENFMIPADSFLLTHLPLLPIWQLKDNPIALEDFSFTKDSVLLNIQSAEKSLDFSNDIKDYRSEGLLDQMIIDANDGFEFNPYGFRIKALYYYNYLSAAMDKDLQKKIKGSIYSFNESDYPELDKKNDTVVKYLKLYKNQSKELYKQEQKLDKSLLKETIANTKLSGKALSKLMKVNDKFLDKIDLSTEKSKDNISKLNEERAKIQLNYPKAFDYKKPDNFNLEIVQPWMDSISLVENELDRRIEQINAARNETALNPIFSNIQFIRRLQGFQEQYIPFNSYGYNDIIDELDSLIYENASQTLTTYTDTLSVEFLEKDVQSLYKKIVAFSKMAKTDFRAKSTAGDIKYPFKYETFMQVVVLDNLSKVKTINYNSLNYYSFLEKYLVELKSTVKKSVKVNEEILSLKEKKHEFIANKREKENERDLNLQAEIKKDTDKWKSVFSNK